MATAVKNFEYEIEETIGVGQVERFIEALGELKNDDTLKVEERKLCVIVTTRPDVAAALDVIFKRAEVKRTWKKKQPENGNSGKLSGIPEPGGIAPYQGD